MRSLTLFFRIFADCHSTEKVLIRSLTILSGLITDPENFKTVCANRGIELENPEDYPVMEYQKKIDADVSADTPVCLLPVCLLNNCCVVPQFTAWCMFSAYLLDDDKFISFNNYIKLINRDDVTDYLVDFFNWVEWDSYHLFALADKLTSERLAEFKPPLKLRIFPHQKANEDEDVDQEQVSDYVNRYHSEDDIDIFEDSDTLKDDTPIDI